MQSEKVFQSSHQNYRFMVLMTMEVDGVDNSSNPQDGGKFANLKLFVTAAREFEATHSESAVNMMTRYLGVSSNLHHQKLK